MILGIGKKKNIKEYVKKAMMGQYKCCLCELVEDFIILCKTVEADKIEMECRFCNSEMFLQQVYKPKAEEIMSEVGFGKRVIINKPEAVKVLELLSSIPNYMDGLSTEHELISEEAKLKLSFEYINNGLSRFKQEAYIITI